MTSITITDLDTIRWVDDLTLTLNDSYTATGTLRFDMANGILEFIVDDESEVLNVTLGPTLPNMIYLSNDQYPTLVRQLVDQQLVAVVDDEDVHYGNHGATATLVFVTMGTQLTIAAE